MKYSQGLCVTKACTAGGSLISVGGREEHSCYSCSSNILVSTGRRRKKSIVVKGLGFKGIDWGCFIQGRVLRQVGKNGIHWEVPVKLTALSHSFSKTLSLNEKIPDCFRGMLSSSPQKIFTSQNL